MADDPVGPERRPGSAAAASETTRGTRPGARALPSDAHSGARRTGAQRTVLAVGAVLSVVLLVTACTVGYFNWRLGQTTRVELDLASAPAGGPETYLVVGSDSRAGITSKDPDAGAFLNDSQYRSDPGDAGRRSDTIMILRIDPSEKTARLLSLPRDLYVPIAGTDHSDKINSAFSIGVSTLVSTIQNDFDITINHYVEVDFVGFQKLVDAMGGVRLYFDKPMWDSHTGLNIATVGCHTLKGVQALAFARSRYLWYNTLGRASVDTSSLRYLDTSQMEANGWERDGTSDLGRISRQQLLIRTAIPQAEHAAFRNPATLNAIMRSVVDSLTVDTGLSTSKMISLANRFRHFDPADLVTYQYPSTGSTSPTAGAIQLPDTHAAEKILEHFRNAGTTSPEQDISLRVLNASGVNHQAANTAGALERVGFDIDDTGDASAEGIGHLETTQVRYAPDNLDAAKVVAEHLSAPVELVPISGSTSSTVDVVTGSNFTTVSTTRRKLKADELPPSASTTTSGAADTSSTTSTTVIGVVPDQDRSC